MASGQRCCKRFRIVPRRCDGASAVYFDTRDLEASRLLLESPPHCFDFWQLGHEG